MITHNLFQNFLSAPPPHYSIWHGTGGTGGVISGNEFILDANGWALYVTQGSGDMVFSGNHIEAGGSTPIHLAKGAGSYNERFVITGNKFDGYAGVAVEMINCNNSIVTGNRYVGGSQYPVYQDAASINNFVEGGIDGLGLLLQANNPAGSLFLNPFSNDPTKSRIQVGIADQDLGTGQGIAIKSYADVGLGIGQEFSSKVYMIWHYDATAANAYATIGTYNGANLLEMRSKTFGFRSADNVLRWISPADGGLQLFTGTRPTCDAAHRGTTFYVAGGAGVLDTHTLCRKDAADAYAWVTLF